MVAPDRRGARPTSHRRPPGRAGSAFSFAGIGNGTGPSVVIVARSSDACVEARGCSARPRRQRARHRTSTTVSVHATSAPRETARRRWRRVRRRAANARASPIASRSRSARVMVLAPSWLRRLREPPVDADAGGRLATAEPLRDDGVRGLFEHAHLDRPSAACAAARRWRVASSGPRAWASSRAATVSSSASVNAVSSRMPAARRALSSTCAACAGSRTPGASRCRSARRSPGRATRGSSRPSAAPGRRSRPSARARRRGARHGAPAGRGRARRGARRRRGRPRGAGGSHAAAQHRCGARAVRRGSPSPVTSRACTILFQEGEVTITELVRTCVTPTPARVVNRQETAVPRSRGARR